MTEPHTDNRLGNPVHLAPEARILVKAVNWLGDLVMSLPALWAIRQAYPRAHLGVLVRSELASFFSATPWVDTVLSYSLEPSFAWLSSRWELVRRLRADRWDAAVVFPRSFSSAFWVYAAGIPERIGVASDARSWMLTRVLSMDTKDPARHQSLTWLELVRQGLGCARPETAPPVHVPNSSIHPSATRGEPFIVFAPGAAYGPAKQWPVLNWVTLGRRLVAAGRRVVLVGTAREAELCRKIGAIIGQGASMLLGAPLLELMSTLRQSSGFVGNDSGATHLAAFLGVPTVALFGSTNPSRTAPMGRACRVLYDPPPCSPCLQRICRFGHYECLYRLTPDQPEQALRDLGAL